MNANSTRPLGGGIQSIQRDMGINALAPKQTQTPQITQEIEFLGQAVDDLRKAMEEHFARLGPCLYPTSETAEKPGGVVQDTLVPLASYIRVSREKIETMTATLRYTTTLIQF